MECVTRRRSLCPIRAGRYGMSDEVAIVVLTGPGLATARRIRACLAGARITTAMAPVFRTPTSGSTDTGAELRRLFAAGVDVVGVCAAGILIRTLAPVLAGKHGEPAVNRRGGRRQRGRAPARRPPAAPTRSAAAWATPWASAPRSPPPARIRWQVALDDPPPGWVLANPHHYKRFAARLLAGEPCRLEGKAEWLQRSGLEFQAHAGAGAAGDRCPGSR